jgi:hypothetical protein
MNLLNNIHHKLLIGMAGLFFISTASAKMSIPVGDFNPNYVVPRSQMKSYLQRKNIKQDLRQAREKSQRLLDLELLSIPDRYLAPDLQKRKAQLKNKYATDKSKRKRITPKSKVVKTRQGRKVKIDETIILDGKLQGAQSVATQLLPEKRLPSVELLQEVSIENSKEIKKEILPGERREIQELFSYGRPKEDFKKPLLKAYYHYEKEDYASSLTESLKILSGIKYTKSTKDVGTYLMAHSLFQAGFYASALNPLIELVDGRWRRSALGMLSTAVEKTKDTSVAKAVLSKISVSQMPAKYKSLYSYHMGRILLNAGAAQAASSSFSQVEPNTQYYGEAQYYIGLILSESLPENLPSSDWERNTSSAYEARVHLEEAAQAARVNNNNDLKDLVNLSLGRLAYQVKLYNQAVFYYNEIGKKSRFTRESIFEIAWALYRLSEFNRSLGQLHPIGSPYYESKDFPELWILRSLNYLKLCRFDESNKAINTFLADYPRVINSINKARGELTAHDFTRIENIDSLKVDQWIQNSFLSDAVVLKDKSRSELLKKEKSRLRALLENQVINSQSLKEDSYEYLSLALNKKIQAISLAQKPYLISRLDDISRNYQLQKEKIDLLKFEVYSQATKHPEAIKRLQAKKLIDDNEFLPGVFLKGKEILWRFSGEYWQDELRGFDFFIPTECTNVKRQKTS